MVVVIRTSGHQYSVKLHDVISIDKIKGGVGDALTFKDVQFAKSVTAKILAHTRGEKLYIRRFKSKVRHRRRSGFRSHLTKVEITAIS